MPDSSLGTLARRRLQRWGSDFAQVGPRRTALLVIFLAVAAGLAGMSWKIPLFGAAERALYDLRVITTAPAVDQDPRVVMVVYKDETLRNTGRRSPLDRGLLGRALTQLDALGPKAIGIDMLVDQAQPEDEVLVSALRGMRTPTHFGFASHANNSNDVQDWQEEFERAFHASFAGGQSTSASVRVEMDTDGAVRRWPSHPKGEPPLLSVSMTTADSKAEGYTGGLRFRRPKFVDRPLYAEYPIDLFGNPITAALFRKAIEGKYVLVGADVSDVDRVANAATFFTGEKPAGLKVHADLLAQLLDHAPQTPIPPWAIWLSVGGVTLAAAYVGFVNLPRGWREGLTVVQIVFVAVGPFVLQVLNYDTGDVPQFGCVVGWLLAYLAAATAARSVDSEQRKFAQSTLGKYLPADVANEILRDPGRLALRGERTEIHAMFSDLQGFTNLTHALEPEVLARLLNAYLDRLSKVVLDHGGTLDKFVGDAVVAFWGAPLARPDDGERAAKAAIAMWREGEAFRAEWSQFFPDVKRTRVGLHKGVAVVGNFGGDGRIQYTALGDGMNTAARLESANKSLDTRMLISSHTVPDSMKGQFRTMGRIIVRGRSTPVEVMEYPDPEDFPPDAIARLNAAFARFDAGETQALDDIRAMAGEHPNDAGLANLVRRLEKVGPGGAYALG